MLIPAFYPILDTETAARHGLKATDAAERMLRGGAKILQFRHKRAFSRDHFRAIEEIAGMCEKFGALFVVNDRADIARLTGAALHLGQEDLTPSQARIVTGPDLRIGYSTHNADQMRAAAFEPADYLAFGPIFATSSKQNPDPVVGLDMLRQLRPLTNRPLVAIGGITRATARMVLDAGADSVAVIGDLYPEIESRVEEFLRVTGA
jgi:thiamine-phosphate pyrophosphorylase